MHLSTDPVSADPDSVTERDGDQEKRLVTDDLRQIEELFQAAADLPIADRTTFLDRTCAGKPGLRHQVERLLGKMEDDTLAPARRAHIGPMPVSTFSEGPGSEIGRYKLLHVIGEGGFGVVYMAEQQAPVVRKVALKIIKLGMDTREVVARFEAERQALALMDHPNIAKVLDGGATDSGRPYFVMELVRGVAITEFCDRNDLSARERLGLFQQVCQAVQHAHQKGVIHRDLKPSNVLVTMHDGTPMPKVIDFGVAKAMHTRLTEKTLFTHYSQFVGTPAYMSPEQAEMSALDVDTRTDIYSLGVILYELLTGTTPLDAEMIRHAGLAEIQRLIRDGQPQRPSMRISSTLNAEIARRRGLDIPSLSRLLQGDLDWIVMKALDKDRSRRYVSAAEFGEDIRRHLSREPVIAGPPGARYRFRKFLARNRAAVLSFCLVATALFAGIVTTTLAMFEADRNASIANRQADRAMVAVDFLLSTLSLANPEIAMDPALSVQTLLAQTAECVDDAFASHPAIQVRVRATIGRAYAQLGQYVLAESNLRQALKMADSLMTDGKNPREDLHAAGFTDIEYYHTLWTLTNVCFNLDRGDSFAVATRARKEGMEQLATTHPELSASLDRFFDVVTSGAWSQDKQAMANVSEIFNASCRATDSSLSLGDARWPIVADTYLSAGYTVWYTPHEPHAEAFWGKALEIQRRELACNHPDTAHTVSLLVGLYNKSGRLAESEELIRDSLGALREVHRHDSIAIAIAEGTLGETLSLQERFEEADPLLLRSHDVIVATVEQDWNFMAFESFMRLIKHYATWGKPAACAPYRLALARAGREAKYVMQWPIIRYAMGDEYQELVDAGDGIRERCGGVSFLAVPGEAKADDLFPAVQRFVTLLSDQVAPDDPLAAGLSRVLLGWANTLDPVAHVNSRRLMATTSERLLMPFRDSLSLDYAESFAMLANCARVEDDGATSLRMAQQAWRAFDGHPPDAWFHASAYVRLGRTMLEEQMLTQAEILLKSAHEVLSAQLGRGHSETVAARVSLFALYTTWGRPGDARSYAPDSSAAK